MISKLHESELGNSKSYFVFFFFFLLFTFFNTVNMDSFFFPIDSIVSTLPIRLVCSMQNKTKNICG